MHFLRRQKAPLVSHLTVCLLTASIVSLLSSNERSPPNEIFQAVPPLENSLLGEHMELLPKDILAEIYPEINYNLVNGSHFCNIRDYNMLIRPPFPCWVADYDGPQKLREIIEHLHNGHVELGYMVDVGGWMGDTAYAAAALGVEVYVFEPVSENYHNLRSSLGGNIRSVAEKIHPFNCAISNTLEKVQIFVPKNGQSDNAALGKEISIMNVGGEATIQEVISLPLDHLFKRSCPSILKIDVQGYEFNVLEGAKSMLSRCSDSMIILVEVLDFMMEVAVNKKGQDVVRLLEKLGYRVVETGQDHLFIGKNNALWPINR